MNDVPKPIGRPPVYTAELGDAICGRLVRGESLNSICKDPDMPCPVTVYSWLRKFPDFMNNYARAREDQADTLADEIIDIADNATNDWMERLSDADKPAGYVLNGEHVQRSRLRVDSRKWVASKLKPKKYSDRLDLNPDKELPMNTKNAPAADALVALLIAKGATDQEIRAALNE